MERKNTWNNLTRKPGRVPHYREKKEENNLFPLYEGQHRYRVRNIKSTPKKEKKEERPSVIILPNSTTSTPGFSRVEKIK